MLEHRSEPFSFPKCHPFCLGHWWTNQRAGFLISQVSALKTSFRSWWRINSRPVHRGCCVSAPVNFFFHSNEPLEMEGIWHHNMQRTSVWAVFIQDPQFSFCCANSRTVLALVLPHFLGSSILQNSTLFRLSFF